MLYSVGCRGSEPSEATQAERMDQGCLLGVQGEGIYGEDYQVFLPDGRAVGQVLVLGPLDPDAGGKQGSIPLKFHSNPLFSKATILNQLHCHGNLYMRQGLHSLQV